MKNKLVNTLVVLFLVILPLIGAIAISRFTPYVEGNSFQGYVIICAVITMAIVSVIYLLFKKSPQLIDKTFIVGALLFLIVCPLIGIYGLATAPDLSVKMLEHPEREHLRYSFLFIALILFGAFSLLLFRRNSFKMENTTRWVMAVVFLLAFAEYTWEFSHHYLYPEGLKEWTSQGKNAADFSTNYDNLTVIRIGVFGRYFQFITVIWLSVYFYRLQFVKLWCPILNIFFSVLGLTSATLVYITQFNFPKGLEIMMLFFIPGIPFFLLYWLGVALLTKFSRNSVAS